MLNNYTKKLLKNFVMEFEGVNLQELDIFLYCKILNVFVEANDLKQLNKELSIFLKELYMLDIKNVVEFLNY